VLFLHRLDHPPRPLARGVVPGLAWTTYAVVWLVLYAGTAVTGAGPHAGDASSPRNGLDTLDISQFHADLVFLLIGLTVGLWFAQRATGGDPRPVVALAAVEVLQAAVGFVQYFNGLPVGVVMLHMLGAGLVVATATWLLVTVLDRVPSVPEELAAQGRPLQRDL
jgi:cytochrome c oxidase assembly protein subunit 15